MEEVNEEEMWEVGLDVVEAYVLKRKIIVMGTGEVRLVRDLGCCNIRGGGGTRGGGIIVVDIYMKLAWVI